MYTNNHASTLVSLARSLAAEWFLFADADRGPPPRLLFVSTISFSVAHKHSNRLAPAPIHQATCAVQYFIYSFQCILSASSNRHSISFRSRSKR